MAPLTWRNVGGANFGDSVAALGLGARSLDRGFTGLSEALGKFSEWQTEQNDRSVLAAANRIQDPTSYRDALASGTILGDIAPTGVSSRALAALDNRSRSLLAQETAAYTLDRTRTNDAAMDSNRDYLAAMAEAQASGDPARIAAVRARFPNAMATLPSDQILRVARDGQALESGAVGMAGQRQSQAQSGERHGWARTDRTDQNAARTAANEALLSVSRDEAADAIENNPDLSPTARAQARALVNSEWGVVNPAAPAATTAAPGRPGSAGAAGRGASGAQQGTPARNALAGGGAANADLISALPYSETRNYVDRITSRAFAANGGQRITGSHDEVADALLPHLIQQESGGRHRNADGSLVTNPRSGAQGLTQVMPATSRDPGYGVRPRQNDSPEEFRRVGRDYLRAMLEKYDGNIELALAAYNAGPGNVDAWRTGNERVRGALTQSGREAATGAELVRDIGIRRSQNRAQGILADYGEAVRDDSSAAEVANALTQAAGTQGANPRAAGPLAGMDPLRVQDEINRLVRRGSRAGVTPAVAGAILARNATTSWHTDGVMPWNWWILGGGAQRRAVDASANDTELERVMDGGKGGLRYAYQSDQATAAIEAAVTQAQQRVQTAASELREAHALAARRAVPPAQLARRELALTNARNELDRLDRLYGSSATLRPLRVDPPGANPTVAQEVSANGGNAGSRDPASEQYWRNLRLDDNGQPIPR